MAYSSARQRNLRRAARQAAREAGLSLEEWVDTLFEDDGASSDDFGFGEPGSNSRPAADDRTAMRLLSHRLDSIESLLADMAERGGKPANADGDALVRELQSAMSRGNKDGRGLAGGLARMVGEDLPISRNAASDALKEIGKRLDRISANMAAAQKTPPQGDATVSRLEKRLDDISRQLKARDQQAAPAKADAAIAAQTRRLEEKLDAMSKQFKSAPRAVSHARLASTPSSRMVSTGDPELTRRIGGIDNAVSQILKRQRDLDAESRVVQSDASRKAEIAILREDIARLATRIDGASAKLGDTLEQRLASLSGQLDTATSSELSAIREEINQLGARIENGTKTNISALREALSRMANMNQPVDLERIENKLIEIASAVADTSNAGDGIANALAGRLDALAQRIEAIAASGGDGLTSDSASAIERQLADLGSEIRARADAGPQALKNIAMQFDRMNARLEQIAAQKETGGTDNTVLADIQNRLEEIATRSPGDPASFDPSAFEALESRISTLTDRLEAMSLRGSGDAAPGAIGELATQVARLAEMVEASESRRPNPPNIDQAMSELVRRVEQVRTSAIDAAKHAAQEVAASLGREGISSADTMSINNLKHELNALRAASETSSSRTEQTLEVMRDVLTTIVERLGDLESDEAAPQATHGHTEPMYAMSQTAADALDDDMDDPHGIFEADEASSSARESDLPMPPVSESASSTAMRSELLSPADDPAYMNLPQTGDEDDDSPIPVAEAGDAVQDDSEDAHLPLAPGASSQEPLPQPQRRPRPDPTPASERASDADRQDFIAAARRAAQKAAAESDARSISSNGKQKSKTRKSIVMISAALIVIVGSLKLYNMMTGSEEAAEEPVAQQSATSAEDSIPAPTSPADAAPGAMEAGEAPAEEPAPAEPQAQSSGTTPADTGMTPAPVEPVDTTPAGSGDAAPAESAPSEPAAPKLPGLSAAPAKEPRVISMTTNSISKGPRLDATEAVKEAQALQAALTQLPAAIGPEGLRKAAIDGDSAAQFEIGSRYTQGRGVAQDLKAAADWYQRAAAQGLAPAQYRLGSLYEKGHGVTRDISMAEMWYMRAADQGNRKAMHNLAVLNAQGAKGEADFSEAARWFRQAAEHGLRDSQFNLAILYARGLGVDADQKEAYKWFAIAAAQGDNEAGQKRDEIASSLSADDVAVAKRMARNWEATPLVDSANFVKASDSWEQAGLDEALDAKVVVRATQTMLNQLGFDAGPADGMMGPRTRDAIKAFQTANGLIPTGIATPDLLTSLKQATG